MHPQQLNSQQQLNPLTHVSLQQQIQQQLPQQLQQPQIYPQDQQVLVQDAANNYYR